jgi:hypothetical protein
MADQREGFDRFFDFYYPRVYVLAWRRHCNESDAQATTQQVLTALLLRALPRGLGQAPDDRELQELAIRLIQGARPQRAGGDDPERATPSPWRAAWQRHGLSGPTLARSRLAPRQHRRGGA